MTQFVDDIWSWQLVSSLGCHNIPTILSHLTFCWNWHHAFMITAIWQHLIHGAYFCLICTFYCLFHCSHILHVCYAIFPLIATLNYIAKYTSVCACPSTYNVSFGLPASLPLLGNFQALALLAGSLSWLSVWVNFQRLLVLKEPRKHPATLWGHLLMQRWIYFAFIGDWSAIPCNLDIENSSIFWSRWLI